MYPTRAPIDKRVIISALVLLVIACVFWFGSRYPQLNEKALMGVESPISGLAFDTIIPLLPDTQAAWRIAINFINWVYTNWRGMTFGILFGAGLLTLLSLLKTVSFRNRFANAALGMLIGAPMGVCANCAAPIAKGLHSAGSRFETSIGALIASPTLNVIVVSISFALLPSYVAISKLVMMVLFILLVVPLLGRIADHFERKNPKTVIRTTPTSVTLWTKIMGWWEFKELALDVPPLPGNRAVPAIIWVIKSFLRSLLFLCLTTIPLMLIAGFIGAVLITIAPLEHMVLVLESTFRGPVFIILGMLILAFFAVFLPVPIAFDVILVAILMGAGLDAKYAMVLLLALGPYSMVAYLVVAQSISHRIAALLGAAIVSFAVLGGIVGHFGEKRNLQIHRDLLVANIATVPDPVIIPVVRTAATPLAEIRSQSAAISIPKNPLDLDVQHIGTGAITVFDRPLNPAQNSNVTDTPFERVIGQDIGLTELNELSTLMIYGPSGEVRATAAGDINDDGWVDIIFNSDMQLGGVGLYINLGGKFVRQEIDLGPVSTAMVGTIALIDINNDGALDLFTPTFAQGNYVFLNTDGTFDIDNHILLPDVGSINTIAPAFADLDQDGDLDIVLGNSMAGAMQGAESRLNLTGEGARDWVLWNDGGTFTPLKLDGVPGHTLTSVLWDVDLDGQLDILIGDDFAQTDKVFRNNGDRTFSLVTKSYGLMPPLLNTTMSFDFGDIDNDLTPEFYGAQIAKGDPDREPNGHDVCTAVLNDGLFTEEDRQSCFQSWVYAHTAARVIDKRRSTECISVDAKNNRAACRVMNFSATMMETRDTQSCANIPDAWKYFRDLCYAADFDPISKNEYRAFMQDSLGSGEPFKNALLRRNATGGYDNITDATRTATPGWSWNSKFTDLDQDGFQDLYILTGKAFSRNNPTNTVYWNDGNGSFENRSAEFGLDDIMPSLSSALTDFDRDGDVDIIRAPVMKHVVVHKNAAPKGGSLWIDLNDQIGNSFGVGATIIVQTQNAQMRRDIKASGGFASFDAPMAHFGIGTAKMVDRIEIRWVGGDITVLNGPIAANSHITVQRQK